MEVGKFRDELLGRDKMLVISKSGYKPIWEWTLAKGDNTDLAEVILCLKVLGEQ